jgi:hypothetical protein
MGKRRAESAFEDNPVINGFLEWMAAPEGQQSIEALDLVFGVIPSLKRIRQCVAHEAFTD